MGTGRYYQASRCVCICDAIVLTPWWAQQMLCADNQPYVWYPVQTLPGVLLLLQVLTYDLFSCYAPSVLMAAFSVWRWDSGFPGYLCMDDFVRCGDEAIAGCRMPLAHLQVPIGTRAWWLLACADERQASALCGTRSIAA